MINVALEKYKLKLTNESDFQIIQVEDEKELSEALYEKWICSSGILLFENKNSNKYYLTVPVYSSISLYIKGRCISDSLEVLANPSEISENSLKQLVAYTFICSPTTLFANVEKLPRWSYLCIDGENYSFQPISITKSKKEEDFDSVMKSSLQLKKCNSRNLLAYSGGLDSTLLYYGLRDNLTDCDLYSISVIGGRDESYYQSIGIPKHETIIKSVMTENDAVEALKSTSSGYELFGCSIALKYDFMFKDVKKRGYENVITGDGPDDIFICQKTLDRFVDIEKSQLLPINSDSEGEIITLPKFSEGDISDPWYWYNFILMAESNYYFERVYAKKNNVELITPFLNPKLISYCAENSQAIYTMDEKQLLKQYSQGIVPAEIINRRKMGFTSDVALWFKSNGAFYSISKKIAEQNYKTPYGNRLKNDLIELLSRQAKAEYNPNESTGGKGILNSLYVKMLSLYWLYKMENDKDLVD